MNVRRLLLDVDKAIAEPSLLDLAEAIEAVSGVEAVNITVEGDSIDVARLISSIEKAGAAVHSIDEVVAGSRIIERVPRSR